jgi:hypothetical protein
MRSVAKNSRNAKFLSKQMTADQVDSGMAVGSIEVQLTGDRPICFLMGTVRSHQAYLAGRPH